MASKPDKMPKATKVFLQAEDGNTKFLDIAPTMKTITHQGRRYFRCPQSCAQDLADGQWGMLYLWEGWGEWRLQQPEREAYELGAAGIST